MSIRRGRDDVSPSGGVKPHKDERRSTPFVVVAGLVAITLAVALLVTDASEPSHDRPRVGPADTDLRKLSFAAFEEDVAPSWTGLTGNDPLCGWSEGSLTASQVACLTSATERSPLTAAGWLFLSNGDSFVTWWRSDGDEAFEVIQRNWYLPLSERDPGLLQWRLFTCWHPDDPVADPDDSYGGPQVQVPLSDDPAPCRIEASIEDDFVLDEQLRSAIVDFYADLANE